MIARDFVVLVAIGVFYQFVEVFLHTWKSPDYSYQICDTLVLKEETDEILKYQLA